MVLSVKFYEWLKSKIRKTFILIALGIPEVEMLKKDVIKGFLLITNSEQKAFARVINI